MYNNALKNSDIKNEDTNGAQPNFKEYRNKNDSESRNAEILPKQQTTDESSVVTLSDSSVLAAIMNTCVAGGSNLSGAGMNYDSDEPDDVMSDEDLLRELEMSPVLPTDFNEKSNTSEKQCSLQLQKKIEDLDKILKDKNTTLTEVLEQDKTYKNPMFLENIIESNDLDEYGTNYLSNVYPIKCPGKYDYKRLARDQQKVMVQQAEQKLAMARKSKNTHQKKASKKTKSHDDHIQKKEK